MNRLKALREEKGISQAELAKMAGLSRATISKIENGDAVNVNTKTILKIAEIFAVQPSEIFLL